LRKHIPGNPNIIMQYMAGGGGRQAANHVYKVAKPDGLMVGSMGAALVANAVLGEPGVQYDLDKLVYLGTPTARSIISLLPTETPVPRTSTAPLYDRAAHRRAVGGSSGLHYRPVVRLSARLERA